MLLWTFKVQGSNLLQNFLKINNLSYLYFKINKDFPDKNITDPSNPLFRRAMENIPQCDIEEVRKRPSPFTKPDDQLCYALAYIRWINKICDQCGYKEDPPILKRCMKCCLSFYCSKECQRKHWDEHKKDVENLMVPSIWDIKNLYLLTLKTGKKVET